MTRRSVTALAKGHYTPDQIAGWMGDRTPSYYEKAIANGRMFVAEREGKVVGFVDADPGEVTRLFLLPEASGAGLEGAALATGGADGGDEPRRPGQDRGDLERRVLLPAAWLCPHRHRLFVALRRRRADRDRAYGVGGVAGV